MNSRFKAYITTNIYIFLLIYIYIRFAQPKYEYLGWIVSDEINLYYTTIISLISSLFIFLIHNKIKGPLGILIVLSYFVIYLPSVNLSNIIFKNNENFIILMTTYSLNIFLLIIINSIKITKVKVFSLSERQFKYVFVALLIVMFSVVFIYYRPSLNNLVKIVDISDLYELREEYRVTNNSIPSLANYFFSWLIKVFIPFTFAFGLLNKSIKVSLLSFLLTFTMFLVSGHKSIVLSLMLIFFIYSLSRKNKLELIFVQKFFYYLVLTSTILSVLGVMFIQDVIIRRTFIVPGLLSNFYFDFFSENYYTLLGYSIFSSFVDYPYSHSPPFIIGEFYFGRPNMSANVNYMASGYADFGIVGSLGMTLICGFYYKALDYLGYSKNRKVLFTVLAIVPTWALMDSSFQTVLITHGLIWLLIFFVLIPRDLNVKYN